ncbi:hypothetical protein V3C99_009585 [Haemonchus contortus]|uniref:Adipokinetic hormone n=1 Tax=Haemonchus contortus TaxID=6289 RepID=A0A7I4YHW4_HAECO
MRSLLILLCALCAVVLSQMTFSDQWNKRSVPPEPFASLKTMGRPSTCDRRAIEEMLFQLSQLHAAQKEVVAELGACSVINRL